MSYHDFCVICVVQTSSGKSSLKVNQVSAICSLYFTASKSHTSMDPTNMKGRLHLTDISYNFPTSTPMSIEWV